MIRPVNGWPLLTLEQGVVHVGYIGGVLSE